jgi:ribonuclease P protein component
MSPASEPLTLGHPTHPWSLDKRLRKAERLLKRPEFLRAQRRAGKFVTRHLVVYASRGGQPWTRLGLTVSRKVGNAAERNRVKRRLREAFRHHKGDLPLGFDLVVIARRGAPEVNLTELTGELVQACNRAARKCKRRPPVGEVQEG